jgi:hypothetical protein
MTAALKILNLVIVFCLRVSIGMKANSAWLLKVAGSAFGEPCRLASHRVDKRFVYWDNLVPKEQTLFAAELFGDGRAFTVT